MDSRVQLLCIFGICGAAICSRAQTAGSADFRFALTGDSIIERHLSVYDEPAYLQMFDRIRQADAAFTNFEMLVNDFEYPGAAVSGGTYMGAPPWVLDESRTEARVLIISACSCSMRAKRSSGVIFGMIPAQ